MIEKLGISVEAFVDWLANKSPPWSSYKAFMSVLLIALYKQPGVRPVGVGETCCQLFAKCVLKVTGPGDTHACKDVHIWVGSRAGIHGAVYRVQSIWDANSTKEIGTFYLLTQKIPLMRSIELECCGQFVIYGCLKLILFLTAIVTGHRLSWETGTGRPILSIVGREWHMGTH